MAETSILTEINLCGAGSPEHQDKRQELASEMQGLCLALEGLD